MLVIFNDLVINIDRVHNFWRTNELKLECKTWPGFYIVFSDSAGMYERNEQLVSIQFEDSEQRDKAFVDILMAHAEDKRSIAIQVKKQEGTQ